MEQILYRRYAAQSQTMPGRKTRPRHPFKQKASPEIEGRDSRNAGVSANARDWERGAASPSLGIGVKLPTLQEMDLQRLRLGFAPRLSWAGRLFPSPQSGPPAKQRYAKSDKGMMPAALMHTPHATGNRPPASPARICSPIHRGQAACSLRRNQGHRRSGGMPAL